ncbi:kinase-like domain-containing protein [Staphylotrichum tortipilum]|uniref:non-specific serine/threonine protein kinase n=1 Tax=Staphylotrichum tortipilum TaxID=2831512 RepID=A0AAN6RQR7_9PEZI|nr:kinase-like domain-containing protein [Staphylotrichum longicolle]
MASPLVTPQNRDPDDEADFRFQTNGTACEWGESYHPGGYHPVILGDILQDRYRIIRKLGYGAFSTAWLAVDLHSNCFAALKIAVANLDREAADHTVTLYGSLPRGAAQHVIGLRDSFEVLGPNGRHLCLSLDPIGPHISTLLSQHAETHDRHLDPWDRRPRFPTPVTRRVLRDALLGLRVLHAHGIVHGDFHPGNILANIPPLGAPLTDASLEAKLQQLPSQGSPLIRRDGKTDLWAPPYLLAPAPLHNQQLSLELDPLVKITDLGAAFFESSPPDKVVTPVALRAPEVILHGNGDGGPLIGRGIDTWAFGCLVFELLSGRPLFVRLEGLDGDAEGDEQTNDEHLIQLSEVLGPLPAALAGRWRRRESYFAPDGERLRIRERGGDDDDDYMDDVVVGLEGDEDGNRDGDEDLEFDLEEDYEAMSPTSPSSDKSLSSSFWFANVGRFAPLEDQLRENKPEDMNDEEVEEVAKLIRWVLDYDTSKRPPVEAILKNSWFSL